MAKVRKTSKGNYKLTLTMNEVQALRVILEFVGGSSIYSPRGFSDAIYDALADEFPYDPDEIPASKLATGTGVHFRDYPGARTRTF